MGTRGSVKSINLTLLLPLMHVIANTLPMLVIQPPHLFHLPY